MGRAGKCVVASVLLAASSAAADPLHRITLRAAGVSGAALAPRLATELGADVAIADGAGCPAPCLDVRVDGAHARATVMFTPAAAPARARAIELGRDRDAWPELIALGAGNLARDQAAPVDERRFVIGIVPGLSTDLADLHVRHELALHVAIGAGGGVEGVSFAGAADIERGPIDGAQLSGAVNVGGDVGGLQVAGALNVARDLEGTQIAPINVARRIDGTQIGVINVGGAGDGISIGLIDLVPGRTDVEADVDSRALGTVLLRHGSRGWHNVYGIGGRRADDTTAGPHDDLWLVGLGLGPTWHTGGATWDLDAIEWHVSSGAHYDRGLSLLNQLRLTVALDLGPIALVAGGALDVYVGDRASAPYALLSNAATSTDRGIGTLVWPTAFVGVRF